MSTLSGKIVVVTGGAGFIGSHIAEALLERGCTVRIIDNVSTGKTENIAGIIDRVDFHEKSILDDAALAAVFHGSDYVFHQGAIPSVPKSVRDPLTSHEVNATGSLKVLLAARDAGVKRVIYAGSSSYYGDTPTLPKHEAMPPNPISPYATQKYMGEAYAQQFHRLYGLETVVLRYFNIFGPRQDPNSEYSAVIPKFVRTMKGGEQPVIFGDGSATRSYTYISDCVAANVSAAETPEAAGEIFNIASERQTSVNELVAAINRVLGTSIAPLYAEARQGDIMHSVADISKAERVLGYEPKVTLEEG